LFYLYQFCTYPFSETNFVPNGVTISRWDAVTACLTGYLIFSGFMACWVVPCWLLFILPLTIFVPVKSLYWHPMIIGATGLVLGVVVFVGSIAVLNRGPGTMDYRAVAPMAALAGAVGLVTALVLSYFFSRAKNMPNQHLSTTEQVKSGDGEASGQR
jgi:hypothetical protein